MKDCVRHPKYSREQLHGKRLAKAGKHKSVVDGRLRAGRIDPDGTYPLELIHPAVPDTMIQGMPPRSSPNEGRILQPVERLDQETVNKIVAAEGEDKKNFDFVIRD